MVNEQINIAAAIAQEVAEVASIMVQAIIAVRTENSART